MNKTDITVMVVMIFFLCVSTNSRDIYAEDMIRYQVIGGNTLVISGTGEVNSVLGFDENIDRSQIKKLIIGEGITKISATRAYLLHLEKNLRKVGEDAFAGCEKLSEMAFPDSVSEIGQMVFSGCTRLKN